MEINWFGFVFLILIVIGVSLKKSFRFVDAFVLTIPFNATVILLIDDYTAINLPLTLLVLSALTYFIKKILFANIPIPKSNLNTVSWLGFIALIAILSEMMPFIINGNYMILDRYTGGVYYAKEMPLYPSIQWITQLLYFLIGLFVVYLISVTYTSINEVKRLLKLVLSGITFMIFWGWIGDFCVFLNIPYPHQLFNHLGMSKEGISILSGWPRMASVTMEASYFAQILIPITPFFYWFSQEEKSFVFNKKYHSIMYFVSIISALLAYTTTGVIGFLLIIGFLLMNRIRFLNTISRYILVLFYLGLSVLALVFISIYLVNIADTYSGVERFKTIYLGFEYFLDYPILGLGWGVFPTYDLFINLLVNFGILGTVSFIIFIFNIFTRFNTKIKLKNKFKPLYKAGLESLILLLIVSELSGFIYHSQYFWLYIGLAISISSLKFQKQHEVFGNNPNNTQG